MKFKSKNMKVDALLYTKEIERVTKNLVREFIINDDLSVDGTKVKEFRTDLKTVPKWFDDSLENGVLSFHIREEENTDYDLYIYNKKSYPLEIQRVNSLDVIIRVSNGNLFSMNKTVFLEFFKENHEQ